MSNYIEISKEGFNKIISNLSLNQGRLLAYFIDNRTNDNFVIGTIKKFIEDTGLSLMTVNKGISKLLEIGTITKIHTGVYRLNLNIKDYDE